MSRIVAGSRGGRRLETPSGAATRPTTDRVREALFSALAAWAGTAAGQPDQALVGLAFLDLYAGSGAVGLEAASRGAAPVLLVESDGRTAALARRNVTALALGVSVRALGVEALARTIAAQAHDVIFADPPYALASERLDAVVADLVTHAWLAPDGLLVLERSSRSEAPRWPTQVVDSWDRSYGETVLHFAALAPEGDGGEATATVGP